MDSHHTQNASEVDTEDVELFKEFIDSKSQSVRNVDSDVCPICFDSVQDNQVSAHNVILLFEVLRYGITAAQVFLH